MGFIIIASFLGILTFLIEENMRRINKRFKVIEDRLKVLENFRIEQEERNFKNHLLGGF